jgi:hypothetical protein
MGVGMLAVLVWLQVCRAGGQPDRPKGPGQHHQAAAQRQGEPPAIRLVVEEIYGGETGKWLCF